VATHGWEQLDIELRRQRHQQVIRPHVGVGDVSRHTFTLQGLEQLAAQHRLATPDFTHNLQKTFSTAQSNQQGIERGLRTLVRVKEGRIRRDRVWGFPQ
jgi:hypothetical protein